MCFTYEVLKAAMKRKGYVFFAGDYNLNLIGVRNLVDRDANTFNDVLYAVYTDNGNAVVNSFAITTDPGTYYRLNPINVNGTAIVRPGQYRGLWKIGEHKGQYEALVQAKPITVYRDIDADGNLNFSSKQELGMFGINCHRAFEHGKTTLVDKWSAGCQVVGDAGQFEFLMALVKISAAAYGNSFTYTLLTTDDVKE